MNFIRIKGLDVYLIGRFDKYSPSRYVNERTRKVHDLLYVVFDYGTDLIGEAKVNAFVLSQSRQAISFFIIAVIGLKFLIKNPLRFNHLLQEIESGWQMGHNAILFLTQDWDALMKLPLYALKHQVINHKSQKLALLNDQKRT